MPVYEFRCESCEKQWEETLSMSEYRTPLGQGCRFCGKSKVRRVFARTIFKFTGDGFESTHLSQDIIDMTPEYWYKDGDPTNDVKENKLDKPKVTVIR